MENIEIAKWTLRVLVIVYSVLLYTFDYNLLKK